MRPRCRAAAPTCCWYQVRVNNFYVRGVTAVTLDKTLLPNVSGVLPLGSITFVKSAYRSQVSLAEGRAHCVPPA